MDLQKIENGKFQTPSTSTKRFVDKIIHNNSSYDNSPFKLLPNFSTPPSRFFKVKNPFDSPMRERLGHPVCSPNLFVKSTPNKEDKFKWSICDISNLKPAEIEANSIEHHSHTDPIIESQIQEKISSFFNDQSVVPSPLVDHSFSCETTPRCSKKLDTNAPNKNVLSFYNEKMSNLCELDNNDDVKDDKEYLDEEVYYKKLFEFESDSIQSSPPMSTGGSPLQFSPLKELDLSNATSYSEENLNKKDISDCALSPINSEKNGSAMECSSGIFSSKSACRLMFSNLDCSDNIVPDVINQIPHGTSFEDTIRTSPQNQEETYDENWDMEFKHVSLASQEYEDFKMDTSLPATPNTGSFTSQRKRLSDSFRDIHNLIENTEGIQFLNHNKRDEIQNTQTLEGSSDMGYCSGTTAVMPSMTDVDTWDNYNFIASTPTKRKN